MAVVCAKCGEELLGSVNRCWRCGQRAVSTPDAADAPPVRRSPVILSDNQRRPVPSSSSEEAPTSEEPHVDDGADDVLILTDSAEESEHEAPASVNPGESSEPPSKETEDKAEGSLHAPKSTIAATVPARSSVDWQGWLAFASLFLGLLAISLGWLTPWMLLPSIVGIACGIVGVMSRRKTLAIIALLVCLLGVTASSVRLAYNVYLFLGDNAGTPIDPLSTDDPFGPIDPAEPLN